MLKTISLSLAITLATTASLAYAWTRQSKSDDVSMAFQAMQEHLNSIESKLSDMQRAHSDLVRRADLEAAERVLRQESQTSEASEPTPDALDPDLVAADLDELFNDIDQLREELKELRKSKSNVVHFGGYKPPNLGSIKLPQVRENYRLLIPNATDIQELKLINGKLLIDPQDDQNS